MNFSLSAFAPEPWTLQLIWFGFGKLWAILFASSKGRKSSITNPVNQGAYTIAGFSSTLQGETWDAVFYVDNLLDERAVIWEYQGYRPETKFTNRPREIGLRLKYKF